MERRYLNEKHRQYSEACQKEVREMMTHPLPREEKEKQMQRNKYTSLHRQMKKDFGNK